MTTMQCTVLTAAFTVCALVSCGKDDSSDANPTGATTSTETSGTSNESDTPQPTTDNDSTATPTSNDTSTHTSPATATEKPTGDTSTDTEEDTGKSTGKDTGKDTVAPTSEDTSKPTGEDTGADTSISDDTDTVDAFCEELPTAGCCKPGIVVSCYIKPHTDDEHPDEVRTDWEINEISCTNLNPDDTTPPFCGWSDASKLFKCNGKGTPPTDIPIDCPPELD